MSHTFQTNLFYNIMWCFFLMHHHKVAVLFHYYALTGDDVLPQSAHSSKMTGSISEMARINPSITLLLIPWRRSEIIDQFENRLFWNGVCSTAAAAHLVGILRIRVGLCECVESLAGCGGSLGCSDSAGSSEALTCWITTPAWSTLWSLANMKWSSISAASTWTEWSHGCLWLVEHIMLHRLDDSAHPTSAWNHPERTNPPFQIPFIFFSAPTPPVCFSPLNQSFFSFVRSTGCDFFGVFQWVLQGEPWGSQWDQFKKDAPFSPPLLGPLGSLVLFIRNLQAFDLTSFPHTAPPRNCCSKFLSELTSKKKKKNLLHFLRNDPLFLCLWDSESKSSTHRMAHRLWLGFAYLWRCDSRLSW